MKTLDNYIAVEVLRYVLFTLLVIVGLELLFTFMDELKDVGDGQYSTSLALQFVLCSIPRRLYEYFPVSALVGGLLAMSTLAAHNELVMLRVAGVSIGRIIFSVMKVAFVLMVAVTLLGEFVAPQAENLGESLRNQAIYNSPTKLTQFGTWIRHDNRFVQIQRFKSGQSFEGVTTYEFDEDFRLTKIQFAKEMVHQPSAWHLKGVKQHLITEQGIRTEEHDTLEVVDWLSPNMLKVLADDDFNLTTFELYDYIDYLTENQLDASHYQMQFWARIAQPLVIAVMLFLSIPIVFGPLRTVSLGLKFIFGAFLGFVAFLLNNVVGYVAVIYHIPAFVGAFLPSMLFFALGYWLLKKTR